MESPDPKSNKKAKTNKKMVTEPVQAKIEVVSSDPSKMLPFIGYFTSGFDAVKSSSGTDVQVYRNKVMHKRTELVVSPAGSSVEFVGTSYEGEAVAAARNPATYMLGVFDKESQTLKIVPIGGNKIFRLEPRVKGVEYKEPPPTPIKMVEEMTAEQLAEKKRNTDAALGTKRSNKMHDKLADMKRDEEPEAKKNLDEKMKNVEVKETALANTEAHVTRHIPPYNSSATTPQEAYVLDKIILAEEWNYLQDIYYSLQKEVAADFSLYPSFIRNRINRLKKIEDDSEKKKLSCILSFINYLVKFKDQHSMDGISSSKFEKLPYTLYHRFTTMFDVTESRRLPPEKMNLLISYVLVLTLFSDDFRTDYRDIVKDLRMSTLTLRPIFEHLGCKFISSQKVSYATLPIPLTFSQIKKRKRKNKNKL